MANGWKTVTLGEVMRLEIDAVPVNELPEFPIAGVYSFARGLFKREALPNTQTTYKFFHRLHKDMFVISVPKAWEGALARVTDEFDGWFLSPVFPTFRADPDKLDIKYFEWFCRQSPVWTELQRKSRGIGARRESVSAQSFLSLEIPLPPLTEQRRIVARIEALAARVAEAQSLRREASEEADKLSGSATYKLFTELANTYKPIPIGKTFTYRNDLIRPTDEKTGEIRFIGLQHVESNTGRRIGEDKLYAETLTGRKFIFSPGDIVYGYLRPYLNKVWIADCDGVCSVDQYVIQPKNKIINTQYLAYFMRSPAFLDKAIELTHNLLLPRLRTGLLNSILIPVPPLEEQRRLVAYLDGLQAQVSALRAVQAETERELSALMPSVLDRAFKGEL